MQLSALYGLLISLVTVAAALGVGALVTLSLIALLSGRRRGGPTRKFEDLIPSGLFLCMSFGLGAGLLSLLTLGMGALVNRYVAAVILVGGVMLFTRCLMPIRDKLRGVWSSVFGRDARLSVRLGAAACIGIVAAAALAAMMPPVEVDVMAYHLGLPKLYAATGRIIETPSIVYSYFPLGTEMLYTLCAAVGSMTAGSLVHLSFGVFAALAAGTLAARLSGEKVAGVAAALVFLGIPMVFWEMRTANNDLAASFYITAALAAALLFRRNGAAVAGLLAGFAVAAKLSAGPYAILLLAVAVSATRGGAKERIGAAVVFGICCVLPALPWLIKTFVETGNPVYPFMYGVFGGENWNPSLHTEFMKWHLGYGPGRGPLEFLVSPYNLTFRAAQSLGGNYGWPIPMPGRELGYLPLLLLPLLLFPGRAGAHQGKLVFFVCGGFVCWFFGSQQLRFLLNILPVLCALYGIKIAHFAKREKLAAAAFGAVLVFGVAWQCAVQAGNVSDAVKTLAGGVAAKENYIKENVPSCEAFRELDRLVGDGGGSAGLVFEARALYSETPVVWLEPSRQGVVDYNALESGPELAARLRELDVKYLLVNTAAFARLMKVVGAQRASGGEYSEYFERFFIIFYSLIAGPESEQLWSDGTFTIYRIKE